MHKAQRYGQQNHCDTMIPDIEGQISTRKTMLAIRGCTAVPVHWRFNHDGLGGTRFDKEEN